jgi:hypothetical protein
MKAYYQCVARRTKAEMLARDGAGRKQCVRCQEWLPEAVFGKQSHKSDGLYVWCKRCVADSQHHLPVERRQQMLADQDGKCVCGYVFDVHGGLGLSYEIDHDHDCCPRNKSCGECVWALVCHSCNMRDRNNPDRTGSGSSKYRGVSWIKREQRWQVGIRRGGKLFTPTVIDRPCLYTNEDEAGQVAAQLDAWLDANPQLWRGLCESPVRADQQHRDHTQRCGDPMNVDQADIAFASFHTTDVGAVQTGLVGELLL